MSRACSAATMRIRRAFSASSSLRRPCWAASSVEAALRTETGERGQPPADRHARRSDVLQELVLGLGLEVLFFETEGHHHRIVGKQVLLVEIHDEGLQVG